MRYLSGKVTDFIIKIGVISNESYEIYQYGFQIGMEMLCCLIAFLGISTYMHMIPECIIFTVIFMLLRTYAGGVHLNSFVKCFVCSVTIQMVTLIYNRQHSLTFLISWFIIISGAFLIWKIAPVENVNRELELNEKKHCKKVTWKILIGIILFSVYCTFYAMDDIVSLIALTILLVLVSQYIGIAKYNCEKKRRK